MVQTIRLAGQADCSKKLIYACNLLENVAKKLENVGKLQDAQFLYANSALIFQIFAGDIETKIVPVVQTLEQMASENTPHLSVREHGDCRQ